MGGILDPPAPSRYPRGIFGHGCVVATRGNGFGDNNAGLNQSDGVNTSGTYRVKHVVVRDAFELFLVYGNHYNGESDSANSITVKAGLENPLSAVTSAASVASSVPVLFAGARTVTIDPGCFAVSDPIPVNVVAGQILYSRTYVAVANSGEKWPLGIFTQSTDFEGNTRGTPGSDMTTSGNTGQVSERAYSPIAVVGTPTRQRVPSVALSGDSITYGSGDYPSDRGWLVRALAGGNVGYVQLAKPGEKVADIASTTTVNAYRRRYTLSFGCTDVIDAYGRNDYANGRTLAQIQADKIAIWARWTARGIRVRSTTLVPGTTSADGWTSLGGQSATAGESVRLAYNAWIRDGGPIVAGMAAATGSSAPGTLRIGDSGHPLTGFYELADAVESARDSGLWKVGSLRTVTDGAISSSGVTLTSTAAAFTAADNGKSVAVTGAGTAGGFLVTTIANVTGATTATLATFAGTTVSGATVKIGDIYTGDGIHPIAVGHAAMSAVVSPTPFT